VQVLLYQNELWFLTRVKERSRVFKNTVLKNILEPLEGVANRRLAEVT